jgi:hypothetical protein
VYAYQQGIASARELELRIKGDWKLCRFSVRGLKNVAKEAIWMVLAFNFSQWIWVRRARQAAIA